MVDINDDTKFIRKRTEIRTGIVRRRRWTDEEKGRIIAEALMPGAVIADVARWHDLAPQHLSNWIKAAKQGRLVLPAEALPVSGAPMFVPVVADEQDKATNECSTPIEIVIGSFVVRVPKGCDGRTLEVIARVLKRATA
jgi:transposase